MSTKNKIINYKPFKVWKAEQIKLGKWKTGKAVKGKGKRKGKAINKRAKGDTKGKTSVETKEQFKVDPRNNAARSDLGEELAVDNQQDQIAVQVPVSALTVQGVAMSYVTYVLSKGYMANADDNSYPYYAYVYLIKILLNAMGNVAPLTDTLPFWLLSLVRALSPKSSNFRSGIISYTWALDSPAYVAPNALQPIGPGAYPSNWNLWVPTTGDAASDLFPIGQVPDSYGSTDENGALAWANLTQFMTRRRSAEDPYALMHALFPIATTKTPFDKDVSAFAQNNWQNGGGWNYTGGPFDLLEHEVCIRNPILSCLSGPTQYEQQTPNRFPTNVIYCGTDALFLGGWLATMCTKRTLNTRIYHDATDKANKCVLPRFKFIDFLEFVDVCGQWMVQLIQAFAADPQFQQSFTSTGGYPVPNLICPLTLQEFSLLLRSVLFQIFKNTQPSVQAMYPRLPNNNTDNEFVAYVSSATTCFLSNIDMQLPLPLIENMYALTIGVLKMSGELFIPVLGQYALDALLSSDYVATIPVGSEGTETVSVFTEGPYMKKRSIAKSSSTSKIRVIVDKGVVPKPDIVEIALVADVISLIDGKNQSTGDYICINDPTRLAQLATIWNNWVLSWPKTYSSALGSVATERGINALYSTNMTRHWIPVSSGKKMPQPDDLDVVIDSRISSKKYLVSGPYSVKNEIAITQQSKLIANPYESFQSKWILPCNRADENNSIGAESAFVRYSSMLGEPFSQTRTGLGDGAALSMIHAIYASKMVHSRTSDEDDWDSEIKTLSARGHAGILSGLVADFVGGIVPGMGNTVSALASMLPL